MPRAREDWPGSITPCSPVTPLGIMVQPLQDRREPMTARTVTITVSDDLYTQLETQARRAARPVDEVVVQTLARGLLATADSELPPAVQAELSMMESLGDPALWEIAGSTASSDTVAVYDLLADRQDDGTITAEGRQMLEQLRDEFDRLTLRKAHAFALLKRRGHTLPALENLPVPVE